MGKGGIKIDMNIRDNRFDNYAFLASIMSYKIAGADESLIAFSILSHLETIYLIFNKAATKN